MSSLSEHWEDSAIICCEELLRRRKARASLLEFIRATKTDYQANWHHRVLCHYMDRWIAGEIKRLMVFAPPRHGKSEIVSRRLPAYILGRNPDARIIACSYSAGLASRLNRDVQRIIATQDYAAIFPETKLFGKNVRTIADNTYLRNSEIFEVVDHRGFYLSAGVGGAITGSGFDRGIIDDPVKNEEEAYSAVIRQSRLDWWRSTFYTRAERDASVVLMMTRWHRSDLSGAIQEEAERAGRSDDWTILRFPAIADTSCGDYDERQPGEPLWPEKYPLHVLQQIQATVGRNKWASLYQQDPRPEGGSEWPAEYFEPHIWFTEWPTNIIAKTVAWDPSKGKGSKWGDYSAFVMLALTSDHELYVDAVMANDMPTDLQVETAVEIQRTFRPDAFGLEVNQFQELLKPDILEASRKHNVPFPLYTCDNRVNKQVRIRRLTPYLSLRQVRFKGGSAGAALLVRQLQDFPHGDHDDGCDALEMAVRLMGEIGYRCDDGLGDMLNIGV